MSRGYTFPISAVSVSAAQDLYECEIPTTMVVKLHELEIGQQTFSGDAEDAQLRITVKRISGAVAQGTGGSSVTGSKHLPGDAASSITAVRNNTGRLALDGGSVTYERSYVWNVRGGGFTLPTPEDQIVCAPGDFLVIGLETAPPTAMTLSAALVLHEIG